MVKEEGFKGNEFDEDSAELEPEELFDELESTSED